MILKIILQNRKELQSQVARIKQTLERVLDKDISLVERIRALFCKQGITIAWKLTAISMTYFNNSTHSNRCLWRK